jgi:hypothetical protein
MTMAPIRPLRSALLAATLLMPVLALPGAARADVTPADAQTLETQLRGWLTSVLGPKIPLPPHPFAVRPEGDHYVVSVGYAGEIPGTGVTITGDPISVSLKPLDATRWTILDFHIPSPLRVDNPGAGPTDIKSYAIKLAEQTTTGVFDPTLATPSSYDGSMRGYTAVTEGPMGTQSSHMDHLATHTSMTPTGGGRVDIESSSMGEKLSSSSTLPDGTPVTFSVDQLAGKGHVQGILFSEIGTIIRAAADVVPMLDAAGKAPKTDDDPKPPVPEEARPLLHAMLDSVRNLLGGYDQEFTMKQIKFDAGGHSGSLANLMLGVGGGAPGGKLDLHMALAMDGLDSPEIPPGTIHDYLPRHFSLKPRVSGVPTADVADLINHAIDSDGTDNDELTGMAMGLLAKGPLTVGIDDLSLDMGPGKLTGSGSVAVSSPVDYVAQAVLKLTGFDALLADANTRPELKQAAPVMIFLKGIGKQEGNAIVWNISFQDKKLLVNGTDLSSMVPK